MFSWLVHKQPAAKLCLSLIFLFFLKKNISYEIFYVEQIAMPFGFFSFFCICFVSNKKNFFCIKTCLVPSAFLLLFL